MSDCDIVGLNGDVLYTFKYKGESKILTGVNALRLEMDDGSMMVVPLNGQYLIRLQELGEHGGPLYA